MTIQPTDAAIGRDVAVEVTAYTSGMLPSLKFWATDTNTVVETLATTSNDISVSRAGKKLIIRLPAGGASPVEVKNAITANTPASALFFMIETGDPTVNIVAPATLAFDTEEKERLTCKNVNTNPEGDPVDITNLNSGGFMETAEESGVHQLKFGSSECILLNKGFASALLLHAKSWRLHVSLFVVWGQDSVQRTEFRGRFDVNEFSVAHNYDQTGAYNLGVGSTGLYTKDIIPNG